MIKQKLTAKEAAEMVYEAYKNDPDSERMNIWEFVGERFRLASKELEKLKG